MDAKKVVDACKKAISVIDADSSWMEICSNMETAIRALSIDAQAELDAKEEQPEPVSLADHLKAAHDREDARMKKAQKHTEQLMKEAHEREDVHTRNVIAAMLLAGRVGPLASEGYSLIYGSTADINNALWMAARMLEHAAKEGEGNG